MPESIGITFAPTQEQADMSGRNMAAQGGKPEAVKFLSLHIPKFVGARPLAPQQLLTANPSSAVSSVVESVLRQLGLDQGGSAPAVPSTPAMPTGSEESRGLAQMLQQAVTGSGGGSFRATPRVTPGLDSTGSQGPIMPRPREFPMPDDGSSAVPDILGGQPSSGPTESWQSKKYAPEGWGSPLGNMFER